jgi:AraC-like DNA-binding protein
MSAADSGKDQRIRLSRNDAIEPGFDIHAELSQRLTIGESLELGSTSRAARLSEFSFARLFKVATGNTPYYRRLLH